MLEISREFRREPQPSEAVLWYELRNRKLLGAKFRRQQPIGSFVVDFYCDQAGLVVEVDGPIHQYQQRADRERQEMLESLELRGIPVSAENVVSNMLLVLSAISAALSEEALPLSLGERGQG
jgi:very-short-patch-repair endonuclease